MSIDATLHEENNIKGKMKSIRPIDITLTKEGYAAEARATGEALEARVKKVDVVDNLTTDAPDRPLSAAQGMLLKQMIDELSAKVGE